MSNATRDRNGRTLEDAQEAAWLEISRLRQEWCAPAAVARLHRRPAFGSSSEFNRDRLTVLGVNPISDEEVRLRTREFPYYADGWVLPSDYE